MRSARAARLPLASLVPLEPIVLPLPEAPPALPEVLGELEPVALLLPEVEPDEPEELPLVLGEAPMVLLEPVLPLALGVVVLLLPLALGVVVLLLPLALGELLELLPLALGELELGELELLPLVLGVAPAAPIELPVALPPVLGVVWLAGALPVLAPAALPPVPLVPAVPEPLPAVPEPLLWATAKPPKARAAAAASVVSVILVALMSNSLINCPLGEGGNDAGIGGAG